MLHCKCIWMVAYSVFMDSKLNWNFITDALCSCSRSTNCVSISLLNWSPNFYLGVSVSDQLFSPLIFFLVPSNSRDFLRGISHFARPLEDGISGRQTACCTTFRSVSLPKILFMFQTRKLALFLRLTLVDLQTILVGKNSFSFFFLFWFPVVAPTAMCFRINLQKMHFQFLKSFICKWGAFPASFHINLRTDAYPVFAFIYL